MLKFNIFASFVITLHDRIVCGKVTTKTADVTILLVNENN